MIDIKFLRFIQLERVVNFDGAFGQVAVRLDTKPW
jgi:hypothetical protein